jgi:hypothetical protein
MSSSRSIAAARQRRGVESAPPIKNNNYASTPGNKDNFNNNQQSRPNYRTTKSNIYQESNPTSNINNNGNSVSKLSVSDAFALVTLRLGRVELIINKLQAEGIIDANNNVISEKLNNGDNNTTFDDTILQNIITRLDGLDKKTVSNDLNQKLQSQYNSLSEDVKQTKEVVMKLQSFIMDVSQKMNTFIATQDAVNEDFFDLRDDFHNSLVNDTTNVFTENDANEQEQLENEQIEESGIHDDNVNNENGDAVSGENQFNDVISDDIPSDDKNIDSLIANNLNNFTEEANDNDTNNTTSISKNKQKNNKNKSMNLNV